MPLASRLLNTLNVFLFIGLLVVAGGWFLHDAKQKILFQGAITASNDLTARYVAHYHQHGTWPTEPLHTRQLRFISREPDFNGTLRDTYAFGKDHRIVYDLGPGGRIHVSLWWSANPAQVLPAPATRPLATPDRERVEADLTEEAQ